MIYYDILETDVIKNTFYITPKQKLLDDLLVKLKMERWVLYEL